MSFREPNNWNEVLKSGQLTLYYADYLTLPIGDEVSNSIIDFFCDRISQ